MVKPNFSPRFGFNPDKSGVGPAERIEPIDVITHHTLGSPTSELILGQGFDTFAKNELELVENG